MADDDPHFMTVQMCRQTMEPINHNIEKILKVTEETQKQINRVESSLYGQEEAGIVKGGLVHMVRDLSEKSNRNTGVLRWFAERLAVPIIVAVIISLVTLAVRR